MKTKLLYLFFLFLGLAFSSCRSDDSDLSVETKSHEYQVITYDFPEFSSSLKSVIAGGLSNYNITYAVYQRGGAKDCHFVKEKNFDKGEVMSISDTLAVGKYYVSIIASSANSLREHSQFLHLNNYMETTAVIHLTGFKGDLLYETFELEVGSIPIQRMVVLERIVSKIEIVIEDVAKMPDNFLALSIKSPNGIIPNDFLLKGKQTHWTSQRMILIDIPREEVLKVNDNNPLWFYIFPTKGSDKALNFDLAISAVFGDTFDYIVGTNEKVIKRNIEIDANQTLRLRGKFFDYSINGLLSANSKWGTTIEEGF